MKRYIFSVVSGHAKLMTDEWLRLTWASFGTEDPSLAYLRITRFRLDPDDLADIYLLEKHRYKNPSIAIAKRFESYATETAAGLAEIFKNPRFKVLYVCVETTQDTYDLTVLQDIHPIAISGSKDSPVPTIDQKKATIFIKNVIAQKAQPLKRELEAAKQKAAAEIASSGGIDI